MKNKSYVNTIVGVEGSKKRSALLRDPEFDSSTIGISFPKLDMR